MVFETAEATTVVLRLLHISFVPCHISGCCWIGTLHDRHVHAWVATFHWDAEKETGHVKLWETASGVVYVLKNRFLDSTTAQS